MGLDGGSRNEVELLVDAYQLLFSALLRAEEAARFQQGAGLAGDKRCRPAASTAAAGAPPVFFRDCMGGLFNRAAALGQSGLIHQQLQLADPALDLCAVLEVATGSWK